MTKFNALNIRMDILQNIRSQGFEEMMPIQEMAIPLALKGRDIIGQAKTGTGKTLAFVIPITEKVRADASFVQALVLTPTRELAIQVAAEFEKIGGRRIRVALIYGGASINTQIDRLQRGVHVAVGTPGRIIDHIDRGTLRLNKTETVVLDEADRMLDMGFIKDMEQILENTPKNRQTMLFSATMPKEVRLLAGKYMLDPEFISVSRDEDELTVKDVQQYFVRVDRKKKMDAFFKVVKQEQPSKALVFCKTKRWVEMFYDILRRRKFSVARIHGDLSQAAREKAIGKLRQGTVTYLVCTDVVARGIDIPDISHVFNYDIPDEPLSYVHRIGRTARVGKQGTAISFITPDQLRDLWLIESKAHTKIHEWKMTGK
ncbi:putative ATP-dependent RNA helicase [ANME-1 cluster archaeon GoMg1]|nr:putative ATP-dependent RNA helicase [ANME-1 cluster archaeon GoMg1]